MKDLLHSVMAGAMVYQTRAFQVNEGVGWDSIFGMRSTRREMLAAAPKHVRVRERTQHHAIAAPVTVLSPAA